MEQKQEIIVKEHKLRGRRKGFKIPSCQALPVKTLWKLATLEEKARAHLRGAALMEYWTGRASKVEISKRLNIPPLRIWQLSQQAISGMLAGLLSQPKTRAKGMIMNKEDDPKKLKKKIAELEIIIERQNRLITVLRTMPGCHDASIPMEEPSEKGKSDARMQDEIPKRVPNGNGPTSLLEKKKRGRPKMVRRETGSKS